MKQINVCHKHSDLLKQARERLRTSKVDDGVTTRPRSFVSNKLSTAINSETSPMGQQVEAAPVTSIVYTGEGGREQKMVGKIVVACSDERGQSNIIIQEVDEAEQETEETERVNLNFSGMGGYMTLSGETGKQVTDAVEEMEHRLEQEMEGKEVKMEQDLDDEASRQVIDTLLPIKGGSQVFTHSLTKTVEQPVVRNPDELQDCVTLPLVDNQVLYQPHTKKPETKTITFYEEPRKPFIYQKKTRISVSASRPVTEKPLALSRVRDESGVLRLQSRGLGSRHLASELRTLATRPELADTVLVCHDGHLVTTSLLLAPALPWLAPILDSVIRIDEYKTVIMPEGVSIAQLTLLQTLLSSANPPDMNSEELRLLRNICVTLKCDTIMALLDNFENNVDSTKRQQDPEKGNHFCKKRKPSSSPRKKTKFLRMSEANIADNQSQVKLEKTELNSDYLHTDGTVRLSSSDEMAMHYCLLCEAKFKKYNQAVTHYDQVHSLRAALSCDMCDATFRDMYNCVKHKHEVHGQFDVNVQCYLCKEVLYSRFRLGTHIKDSHKSHYGEFICKACGMKFAARYYLQIHQQESHSDIANTCGICNKTFSGKRYLTMHIKANHESPSADKK